MRKSIEDPLMKRKEVGTSEDTGIPCYHSCHYYDHRPRDDPLIKKAHSRVLLG